MQIKIKKLSPLAVLPRKATPGSAAYDVYIPQSTTILNGRNCIPLGFAMEIPEGYEAKIEPRSGFSLKGMEDMFNRRHNADVLVGKIDSDYRGEVGVIIKNDEFQPFQLEIGTRIAQMTIYRVEAVDFTESDTLSETERGEGGFGHSGTKE